MTEYLVDATRGTAVTRSVHAVGGVLSEQNPDGTWEWLLRDGLGSVRSVTDAAGAVLETVDYSPYGVANAALTRTAYGFTGEMIDTNGRVYLRARYYHPTLGTFPTLDPFEGVPERPLSLHGYSYANGNPVTLVDLRGLSASVAKVMNGGMCQQEPPPFSPTDFNWMTQPLSPYERCLQQCDEKFPTIMGGAAGATAAGLIMCRQSCQQYDDMGRFKGVISHIRQKVFGDFPTKDYPPDCTLFSNATNCMLYQMWHLNTSQTISQMRTNGPDLLRFAGFVFPDDIFRKQTGHSEGAPADVKEYYDIQRFYQQSDDSACISLFGEDYGFDVPGNVMFGYLGSQAGIDARLLLAGGGAAQFAHDIISSNPISSVSFLDDLGDSPEDKEAVITGILLSQSCGDKCTYTDVKRVFDFQRQNYVSATAKSKRASCRPPR